MNICDALNMWSRIPGNRFPHGINPVAYPGGYTDHTKNSWALWQWQPHFYAVSWVLERGEKYNHLHDIDPAASQKPSWDELHAIWRKNPPAESPDLALSGLPEAGGNRQEAVIDAAVSGGAYDVITYFWAIGTGAAASGAGQGTAQFRMVSDLSGRVAVSCTVAVRGAGVNARQFSEDGVSVSAQNY